MKETKFKQTDIGLIPEDWNVVSLSSVIDECNYGVGAEAVKFNGKIKYLRITDIDDENHRYVPRPLASPSFYSEMYLAKVGDLFVARTGASVGKSYLYNENDGRLIFAGFLIKVHVSFANPYFVFLNTLTVHYKNWILSESARTGQPGINSRQLKEFCFSLPPTKEEQERIANALSQMDDLIAVLDEQIEKKKFIKQGAMQQLLTGKTRLKGFTGEWKTVILGKIGNTYNGITGKTSADFGLGDAKYITFLNILNNPIIDTSLLEKVNISQGERQNAVRKGDLFFNTSSETPEEVGICAVIMEEIDNLYLNSFCFGFRLFDENVDGKYLAYFFRSKAGRDLMVTLAQGATRYNLSKSAFDKSEIVIPSDVDEQHAIANIFSTMDDEIQTLQEERAKYALVKQGMMQQLLTGKIRLN